MGSDISRFSDGNDEVFVPIIGLQGGIDLRAVSLPPDLPPSVSEVFPSYKHEIWNLELHELKPAFQQYSGGRFCCLRLLFDFRSVLVMAITLLRMNVFIKGFKMSNIIWNAVRYPVTEPVLSKKLKIIL